MRRKVARWALSRVSTLSLSHFTVDFTFRLDNTGIMLPISPGLVCFCSVRGPTVDKLVTTRCFWVPVAQAANKDYSRCD